MRVSECKNNEYRTDDCKTQTACIVLFRLKYFKHLISFQLERKAILEIIIIYECSMSFAHAIAVNEQLTLTAAPEYSWP